MHTPASSIVIHTRRRTVWLPWVSVCFAMLCAVGCGQAAAPTARAAPPGTVTEAATRPSEGTTTAAAAAAAQKKSIDRTPQPFSRIIDSIDLRTIPIPENAEVVLRYAGEYLINREEDIADSVTFIRERLGALGCEQVPWPDDTFSADMKYLLFQKDGYLLTAFAAPHTRDGFKSSVTILNVGNLDATTLPHPPGTPTVEEKYRGVYALAGDGAIGANATRLREAFTAAGWHEYRFAPMAGGGTESGADDSFPMFMRGGISVRGHLEEKDGRTLARLNTVVMRTEFPLPTGARDVRIDTLSGASVSCLRDASLTDTLAFYRERFAALGWKEVPQQGRTSEEQAKVSFQRGNDVSVVSLRQQATSLRIDIEGLVDKQSADVQRSVARAEARRLQTPTGPGVTSPSSPAAAVGMRDDSSSDRPKATPPKTAAIEPLMIDDILVPGNHVGFETTGSRYRTHMHVTSPSTPAEILFFYREHLGRRGWKEKSPAAGEGRRPASFVSDDGVITLSVETDEDEATIELDFARTAAAKAAGLLPESGRVLVVMANESDGKATVVVGGETTTLAAGVGAQKPDGPRISLPPGRHTVTITSADGRTEHEVIDAGPDHTWALVVTANGPVVTELY